MGRHSRRAQRRLAHKGAQACSAWGARGEERPRWPNRLEDVVTSIRSLVRAPLGARRMIIIRGMVRRHRMNQWRLIHGMVRRHRMR